MLPSEAGGPLVTFPHDPDGHYTRYMDRLTNARRARDAVAVRLILEDVDDPGAELFTEPVQRKAFLTELLSAAVIDDWLDSIKLFVEVSGVKPHEHPFPTTLRLVDEVIVGNARGSDEACLYIISHLGPEHVNGTGPSPLTSLHFAASVGRLEVVRGLVLDFGADLEAHTSRWPTPARRRKRLPLS